MFAHPLESINAVFLELYCSAQSSASAIPAVPLVPKANVVFKPVLPINSHNNTVQHSSITVRALSVKKCAFAVATSANVVSAVDPSSTLNKFSLFVVSSVCVVRVCHCLVPLEFYYSIIYHSVPHSPLLGMSSMGRI